MNIYRVDDYVSPVEGYLVPRPDSLGVQSVYTFYRDNAATSGLFFPEGQSRTEKELRDLWSFGRQLREAQAEQDEMGINILLALCCVYLLTAALFESFLHPLVIMMCIPFAGLGVIWTLMISHTPLNLLAMIGIVILIGVVVNNGIASSITSTACAGAASTARPRSWRAAATASVRF
jgi:HAE1 family hydrophobic/amphiphilic exporter-1